MKSIIVIVLFYLVVASQAQLPINFKKCSIKQADARKCMLQAAQIGISQLTKAYPNQGIPSANPLLVPEITIGKGVGKVIDVVQYYSKCKIFGIPNLKVTKFNLDTAGKKFLLEGEFPKIEQNCWFKVDGVAMGQQLKTEGDSVVTFVKATIVFEANWQESKKSGKTFMKIVSPKLKMEIKELALNFPTLSKELNAGVNQNSMVIYKDVQPHYEQKYGEIFQKLANQFFGTLSMEELFR